MLPHMTGFLTHDGEDAAEAVLECNRRTEECGLSLSASEARTLCRTRSEALSREPEADRRLELLGRVSAYGDLIEWLHDTAPSREELQRMLHRLPADAWVVLMAQYPEESLLTDPQDRRLCAALRQLCDGLPRAEAEVLRRAAAHVYWE